MAHQRTENGPLLFEPPALMGVSNEALLAQIDDPSSLKLPTVPLNSQCVERLIRLVSEVSGRVNPRNREYEILNTLHSQRLMPCFKSRQDWEVQPDNVN